MAAVADRGSRPRLQPVEGAVARSAWQKEHEASLGGARLPDGVAGRVGVQGRSTLWRIAASSRLLAWQIATANASVALSSTLPVFA